MKLINKKLNLTSDDVLACEDYAQLKYWYAEVEKDVLQMETDLLFRYEEKKELAKKMQGFLSKTIQLQMAKVGKPRDFNAYIVSAVKELFPEHWENIVSFARKNKELDEL